MYKTFNASQNNPTGTQYFSGSQHTQNLSKFYGFSFSSFLVSSFKNSCIYDMFIVEIFAIRGNIKVVSKTNRKLDVLSIFTTQKIFNNKHYLKPSRKIVWWRNKRIKIFSNVFQYTTIKASAL